MILDLVKHVIADISGHNSSDFAATTKQQLSCLLSLYLAGTQAYSGGCATTALSRSANDRDFPQRINTLSLLVERDRKKWFLRPGGKCDNENVYGNDLLLSLLSRKHTHTADAPVAQTSERIVAEKDRPTVLSRLPCLLISYRQGRKPAPSPNRPHTTWGAAYGAHAGGC